MNSERNGEFVARDSVKIGFFVVSTKFVYLSRRMLLRRWAIFLHTTLCRCNFLG